MSVADCANIPATKQTRQATTAQTNCRLIVVSRSPMLRTKGCRILSNRSTSSCRVRRERPARRREGVCSKASWNSSTVHDNEDLGPDITTGWQKIQCAACRAVGYGLRRSTHSNPLSMRFLKTSQTAFLELATASAWARRVSSKS